jgi:hypothetical protein
VAPGCPRRLAGALASQLASNELVYQLAEALAKPRALAELPELLAEQVGRPVPEAEILAWLALGAATGRGVTTRCCGRSCTRFVRGCRRRRGHLLQPGSAARLWLAGEDADSRAGRRLRRFPVITCTTCGQHYYETWVKDFGLLAGVKAGPAGGDLNRRVPRLGAPPRGDRRDPRPRRPLVVSPDEDDDAEEVDEDGDMLPPSGHDFDHRRLHPMFVCSHCGSLHEEQHRRCAACNVRTRS